MASVNISAKEYEVLASVILDLHARGQVEDAEVLDKLAKKANKALTMARYGYAGGGAAESKMRADFEAPSPLETLQRFSQNS